MTTGSNSTLATAIASIRRAWSDTPVFGIVLGSGLGALADEVEGAVRIPYASVPGMPAAGVSGHAGRFVFGRLEGRTVAAMQGRVHLYEGHSPPEVVLGVRIMIRLGAKQVLLTNAAGGIGKHLSAGDLMVIDDHLNLTGANCLVGPNEDQIGPRFPDMSEVYDGPLRRLADRVAGAHGGPPIPHGIYAGVLGPSYETPAEIGMLRAMGADAVGMSTVLEAIAARHMGARCLGLSCITNLAAGLAEHPLDHSEVQATAHRTQRRFTQLIRAILREDGRGHPETGLVA